ncbi:hypothetical protein ACFQZ4_45440 [Catellatospora coxensis]
MDTIKGGFSCAACSSRGRHRRPGSGVLARPGRLPADGRGDRAAPRRGGSAVDFRGGHLPVLERMGVLDALREAQTGGSPMRFVDADGRRLMELPGDFAGERSRCCAATSPGSCTSTAARTPSTSSATR